MRYRPQIIELCIIQCSRQCSNKPLLRGVIEHSLRGESWSEDLNGSFQERFILVVRLLVDMINILRVCPDSLRDETLRSNV